MSARPNTNISANGRDRVGRSSRGQRPPFRDDDRCFTIRQIDHITLNAVAQVDPIHTVGKLANDADTHLIEKEARIVTAVIPPFVTDHLAARSEEQPTAEFRVP